MKLVEDTHYRRRLDQPSSSTYGSKAYVDYLLCGVPMVSVLIITMNLLEGTHFRRRLDQPSHIASKEFVECLFCIVPSDSDDDHAGRVTFTQMQAKHSI